MDSSSLIIIVVIALISFLVFYIIGIYNRLVTSKNIVNDRWNEIDNQLKRKIDLIPKLIDVIKKYALQEEALFVLLLTDRNKISNAFSINDKIDFNNKMNVNLNYLLELKNNYPKLVIDEKFKQLVDELKEIDGKIDYAKEFYNEVAINHNNKIAKFPTNIVAMIFNFKSYELFRQ